MKGITYTQIAQYVIMIIAYTIPAIFISFMLTGNPIPQLGLGSKTEDGTYLLDKLDKIVVDLGFNEYTTHARLSHFNMFFYTLSLMIGTAGLPHVIMRFLQFLQSKLHGYLQVGPYYLLQYFILQLLQLLQWLG